MGLRETVKGAAKAAFKAVGNLKTVAIYKRMGDSVYDPDTGVTTPTVIFSYDVEIIALEMSNKDRLGEHVDTVKKLYLMLGSEIGSNRPVAGDILTIDSIDEYVVDSFTDSVEAVWEIGI